MLTAFLSVVAILSTPCAAVAADRTSSITALVEQIKVSTASETVFETGRMLAERKPDTEEDLAVLFGALDEPKAAQYAQMAMAGTMDGKLGKALHAELKRRMGHLRHIPDEELQKLSQTEQDAAMREAMGTAAIVQALSNVGYKPAIEDLRTLLAYDREFQGYLSMTASATLGQLGDKASLETLMKKASEGGQVTLSGFGRRGIGKAINELNQYWEELKAKPLVSGDPRRGKIQNLAEQLPKSAGRGDKKIVSALQKLLDFPLWDVRCEASEALMLAMNPTDRNITREMVKHEEVVVRMRGILSLRVAKTWDKNFLPILIDMMQHDPDPVVRRTVVAELGALIGEGVRRKELEPAVPYIEKAIKDKDVTVRGAAFDTLRLLTGRYQRYEGMFPSEESIMKRGPEFLHEDLTRTFDATMGNKK